MAVADRAWHDRTLKFIDMLISLGSTSEEPTTPAAGPPAGLAAAAGSREPGLGALVDELLLELGIPLDEVLGGRDRTVRRAPAPVGSAGREPVAMTQSVEPGGELEALTATAARDRPRRCDRSRLPTGGRARGSARA